MEEDGGGAAEDEAADEDGGGVGVSLLGAVLSAAGGLGCCEDAAGAELAGRWVSCEEAPGVLAEAPAELEAEKDSELSGRLEPSGREGDSNRLDPSGSDTDTGCDGRLVGDVEADSSGPPSLAVTAAIITMIMARAASNSPTTIMVFFGFDFLFSSMLSPHVKRCFYFIIVNCGFGHVNLGTVSVPA